MHYQVLLTTTEVPFVQHHKLRKPFFGMFGILKNLSGKTCKIVARVLFLYNKMFHCKTSQSLKAMRFVFKIIWSLRNLTGTFASVPVRFQSDANIYTTNLMALRLPENLQYDVLSGIETRPLDYTCWWSDVKCNNISLHSNNQVCLLWL